MQLGEHLISLRHGIDVLELDFSISAAAFAATDEYEVQGSVSPLDWIRHHCRMTGHAASRAVAAGEQLGRLPASARALDAGEIGFAHLSLLAGVARRLTQPLGAVDPDIPAPSDPVAPTDPVAPADPDAASGAEPADPADPSAGPLRFDERHPPGAGPGALGGPLQRGLRARPPRP